MQVDAIKEALYLDEEMTPPPPTIQIKGRVIATPGNFITINGLPKNFKSSVMNLFLASAITGAPVFDIEAYCKKTDQIVIIDTEQGKYDFFRQMRRLKFLLTTKKLPKTLHCYLFRKFDPDVILQSIEQLMKEKKPAFLFIDNLTELVMNPNDMVEAKFVVQKLKNWSDVYGTTIVSLLHLGKTNFNSLGNLGSYADRGAQSALKVSHDKETGTITLEPTLMRSDGWFEPVHFAMHEGNLIPASAPIKTVDRKKFDIADLSLNDHCLRIEPIFAARDTFTYDEIAQELKKAYGVGQNAVRQKLIPFLRGHNYIVSDGGQYRINKYKTKQ